VEEVIENAWLLGGSAGDPKGMKGIDPKRGGGTHRLEKSHPSWAGHFRPKSYGKLASGGGRAMAWKLCAKSVMANEVEVRIVN